MMDALVHARANDRPVARARTTARAHPSFLRSSIPPRAPSRRRSRRTHHWSHAPWKGGRRAGARARDVPGVLASRVETRVESRHIHGCVCVSYTVCVSKRQRLFITHTGVVPIMGHDSSVPWVRRRDRTRGHSRARRAIHAFHACIHSRTRALARARRRASRRPAVTARSAVTAVVVRARRRGRWRQTRGRRRRRGWKIPRRARARRRRSRRGNARSVGARARGRGGRGERERER